MLAKPMPHGIDLKVLSGSDTKVRLLVHSPVPPSMTFRSRGRGIELKSEESGLKDIWLVTGEIPSSDGFLTTQASNDTSYHLVVLCDKLPNVPDEYFKNPPPDKIRDTLIWILPYAIFTSVVLNVLLRNQFLTDIERGLAALIASSTALLAILGVRFSPMWMAIPFNYLRRKTDDATITYFSLVALFVLLAFIVEPIRCLLISYQYERNIVQAVKSNDYDVKIEKSINAIRLMPMRLEPYMILEKVAIQFRAADRNTQSDFYKTILARADFMEPATAFLNGKSECECVELTPDELGYIHRQVLSWLFHAAEVSHGYRDGVNDLNDDGRRIPPEVPVFEERLLAEVRDSDFYAIRRALYDAERLDYTAILEHYADEAKRRNARPILIGRPNFRASPHTGYPQPAANAFMKMRQIVDLLYAKSKERPDDARVFLGRREDFPSDYVVMLAFDKLIKHDLLTCNFRAFREKLAYFIHLREENLLTERLWLFGPDTLQTFQVFRAMRSKEETSLSHVYLLSYNQLANFSRCDNWKRPETSAGNEPWLVEALMTGFGMRSQSKRDVSVASEETLVRDQMRNDFPGWYNPNEQAWLKNTIDGLTWEALGSLVREEAKSNWRY